jgi:hypothetical protein
VTSVDEVVKKISQKMFHMYTECISANKMAVAARHAAVDGVFIKRCHTKRHDGGERRWFDFGSILLQTQNHEVQRAGEGI